ncbi:MAG: TolC family protein [Peptococcaceae bacterium]|jgi:outer membrane protein TolC|nr:TolC family protein [Peptococcaceae bacterium]
MKRKTGRAAMVWLCAAAAAGILWAGILPGAELKTDVPVYTMKEVRDKAIITAPDILKQKTAVDSAVTGKNAAASTMESARADAQYQYSESMTDNELNSLTDKTQNAIDAYNSAASGLDDEREKLENLEKQVAYSVDKLYLDILSSQVSLKAQEISLESDEKNLETLELKVKLGLAPRTEADAASQTVKNARNQLETAKKSLADLKLSMNVYLGMKLGDPFELADPPELREVTFDPDVSSLQQKALEHSLSLRQADRNIEEISKKADMVVGTSQENQRDSLANQGRSAVLNREQAETNLRNSVTNAFTKLEQAEKSLELNMDKLDSAKKDCEKKQLQQKLGLISAGQLTQAETAAAQAEDSCVQSRYSIYLAKRALELLAYGITV